MLLSCAMDGGDPAIAELVQNIGAETAWAKIIEGVLGEPAGKKILGSGSVRHATENSGYRGALHDRQSLCHRDVPDHGYADYPTVPDRMRPCLTSKRPRRSALHRLH